MEDIKVSILCAAYNHEKYIRQTLDGFVKQKTNFKYEVIIHDDASTDKTAQIIREYQAEYPDIIKPILQTENQFSKKNTDIACFYDPSIKRKVLCILRGR